MDQFLEEVVTKRNRGAAGLLIVAANIAWVVLGIYAFFNLQLIVNVVFSAGFSADMILPIVSSLISAGLAVLLVLRRDRL